MKNPEKTIRSLEQQEQKVDDVKGGKKLTSGAFSKDNRINENILSDGKDKPTGSKPKTHFPQDKPLFNK